MKRRILGPALLAVAILSLARDASADEGVDSDALLAVVGFGALDVGLAVSDLAAAVQGEWHSRVYGGFEAVAAATQVAICLDKSLSTGPTGSAGMWEVGVGFGAIFMAHGLVTLLAPRSHTEAPARPGAFTVAPVALSDVARASVPGMAVLGRF